MCAFVVVGLHVTLTISPFRLECELTDIPTGPKTLSVTIANQSSALIPASAGLEVRCANGFYGDGGVFGALCLPLAEFAPSLCAPSHAPQAKFVKSARRKVRSVAVPASSPWRSLATGA